MGDLIQNEVCWVGHLTFLSWPNAGQWCKLKNFVIFILSFSMCPAFMVHGFYIHCFVGAFESLWKSLLKLGILGWTINFIKIKKPPKDSFARLRLRSIEKSGFRFWNLAFGFCNESWNGFHLREICPQGQFQLRNPNLNFMDLLFTVRLGNLKKVFAKLFSWTAVFFLLILCARTRPLFLRTVFHILLQISHSNGKNKNPITDISSLKSVFVFRVRL